MDGIPVYHIVTQKKIFGFPTQFPVPVYIHLGGDRECGAEVFVYGNTTMKKVHRPSRWTTIVPWNNKYTNLLAIFLNSCQIFIKILQILKIKKSKSFLSVLNLFINDTIFVSVWVCKWKVNKVRFFG